MEAYNLNGAHMTEQRSSGENEERPDSGPKRPYSTPTLTEYGSVSMLTAGTPSGKIADGPGAPKRSVLGL